MSAGMCIAILVDSHNTANSASRKYFTLGWCCSPKSKIFLFGRVWQSCNNKASPEQINGSTEIMLAVSLGGTVLFLPVKWQEAETIYRCPRCLERFQKYFTLGGCCGLALSTEMVNQKTLNWCYLLTLGGCV